MTRARFVGVGAALPETVIPNAFLETQLGLDPGWIERTGIRERRVLGRGESLVDLAEQAAREALAQASLTPAAIDSVVVATTSGDYRFPSLACQVHERLGLHHVPAFDVAAACAGFPYALSVADQGIRAGDTRTVLVLGADALTRFVDPTDRGTARFVRRWCGRGRARRRIHGRAWYLGLSPPRVGRARHDSDGTRRRPPPG